VTFEFSGVVKKENLNEIIRKLVDLSTERTLDEYGVLHLKINLEGKTFALNITPRIDPSDFKIMIRIWGRTSSEEIIHALEKILETKVNVRKLKPSILAVAGKIIEIYNSGIRERGELLKKVAEELGLSSSELSKFISLLRESASRRVAHEKIKKAYEILKYI